MLRVRKTALYPSSEKPTGHRITLPAETALGSENEAETTKISG